MSSDKYYISGCPERGLFTITPSPHDWCVSLTMVSKPKPPSITFEPSLFASYNTDKANPINGVFKPHPDDWFWPACRAHKIVKAVNPESKRQCYDQNIRYLATMANMEPEELRKTNPLVIGTKLGLTYNTLATMIDRNDFVKLSHGWGWRGDFQKGWGY
jgi:hypothetical protein